MSEDNIYQIIRYLLLFGGGFMVQRGFLAQGNLELIVGAVAGILPFAWGMYVKWGTTPVTAKTAARRDVPTVSGVTGAVSHDHHKAD